MANRYLDFLLDNNYLETYDHESKGKESYKITEEGEVLFKSVNIVKDICEEIE